MDSHSNLAFFNDWAPQIHSTHWDKRIDALVSLEKLLFVPFLELNSSFDWDKHKFIK